MRLVIKYSDQSTIPNPQSPIPNPHIFLILLKYKYKPNLLIIKIFISKKNIIYKHKYIIYIIDFHFFIQIFFETYALYNLLKEFITSFLLK